MATTEPDDGVAPPELFLIEGGRDRAEEVAPTGELDAHRSRALAAVADLPDDGVLSHVSAACLLALPIWDVPLLTGPVQATRPGPGTRIDRVTLTVRPARLTPDETMLLDGVPVTTVARTLVDLGRWAGRSTTVVCADAALRDGLVSRAELQAALDRAFGTAGIGQARTAIGFADGRSPDVAASRARVAARWPEPVAPPRGSDRRYPQDGPDEPYWPSRAAERYRETGRYGEGPDGPGRGWAGPWGDPDEWPIPPEDEWPGPSSPGPGDQDRGPYGIPR